MPEARFEGGPTPATRILGDVSPWHGLDSLADKRSMKIIGEFKTFISRGSVIDLAVGVVIGGAFGKLVDGVVKGIIEPAVALIRGTGRLDTILTGFTSLGSGILNFLLLAAVVFFVFVKPMNKWKEFTEKKPAEPAVPPPPTTEQLLTEIRDLLKAAKN